VNILAKMVSLFISSRISKFIDRGVVGIENPYGVIGGKKYKRTLGDIRLYLNYPQK